MTEPIRHAYLVDATDKPLEFIRKTAENCPICNQRGVRPKAVLAVYSEDTYNEVVHCLECDHTAARPRKRVR